MRNRPAKITVGVEELSDFNESFNWCTTATLVPARRCTHQSARNGYILATEEGVVSAAVLVGVKLFRRQHGSRRGQPSSGLIANLTERDVLIVDSGLATQELVIRWWLGIST